MAEERAQRRLAAIMAADVVGYSALMGADETGTLAALKQHHAGLIDPAIAGHRGRIVKLMGDGVLAEFASVVDAVECAVGIQLGMAERNRDVPDGKRIAFRIGINLGDVIIDGDDIHGDGVNVAARLEGLAEPGGICIADIVHQSVDGKLELSFTDLGAQQVKNIARPVRAYSVRLAATAATTHHDMQPSDKPSIAVLPFDNMSGDPEQAYFADGIAEDIITDLSKVSGLFVIARNSSFAYRGKSHDLRQVCRELGVRYVLEGSVRKAGNRVRINAQLIEGSTGGHIWADRYDRDLADIFAVQDEVTREIVAAFRVALTASEQSTRRGRRKVDPEAYDLLVRGRELLFRFTEAALAEGRVLLERAMALDPNMAAAPAALSSITGIEYQNGWNGATAENLQLATALAEQACRVDPGEPRGFHALALSHMWLQQFDDAERAATRSVELNPNFGSGYAALGQIHDFLGRHETAIEYAHKVLSLDPRYHIALQLMGRAQFALGRDTEAAACFERRLDMSPVSDMSRVFLAAIHGHAGRVDEARQRWAEILEINPQFSLAQVRRALPYQVPDVFDRLAGGLEKAGLPV